MSRRRAVIYGIFLVSTLTSVARSAPLPEAELKNLLAAIRDNRTTQADFHEHRVIRLMKNPVVGSGTVWFHLPNEFRREVEENSPNFKSAERYPLGKGPPLDAMVATTNSALSLENIEAILIGVPFFYRWRKGRVPSA